MATQHGLVTRAQAVDAGASPERIDRWVRSGKWIAVRRGVYAVREMWELLTRWEDRQRLRDRAASLRISKPHVMSHDSAALEHGLPILRPATPITHVTRTGIHGSRNRFGVKHHLAPYLPEQVVESPHGVPVHDLARTAVDIGRERGLSAGVVAIDAARQAGTPLPAFARTIQPMRCWPQITVVREAIALSDDGAESVGETLARLLVTELGFGRPETQFGLTDGHRDVWCDLRLGRHVFEFDGKHKYQRADDRGLAGRDPGDIVWREKQRQDFVCGFKLGMSRIVWSDFWGEARAHALMRLAREYADTTARFGEDIRDLTPYVIRRPRRRAA